MVNEVDLISVIIPVYNMERFLQRCLDSVCNNTYTNLEIICINDGSKDSSLDILRKYQSKDNRIILIDQKNQKLSAARNAGLNIAKGKWIALIDSDDWIHPKYFEALLTAALNENADISICDAIVTSSEENEIEEIDINKLNYRSITKAELNKLHIARSRVWGKLYRKDIIGELRFISGAEPVEDNCFNTMLYSTQMRYCLLDEKLYYYFMRMDSAIHQNTGRKSLVYPKYILPALAKEQDQEKRADMVRRCYNILLSARYGEMYAKDFGEIKKMINSELSQLRRYRKYLPLKERIIYFVLGNCPQLYRAWRIHNDPTMLIYEKKLKEKSQL